MTRSQGVSDALAKLAELGRSLDGRFFASAADEEFVARVLPALIEVAKAASDVDMQHHYPDLHAALVRLASSLDAGGEGEKGGA
jgi:hypothetical protein